MMLKLLEFKEKIKNIYADYDLYVRPVLKFLLSLLALILIDNNLGYLDRVACHSLTALWHPLYHSVQTM